MKTAYEIGEMLVSQTREKGSPMTQDETKHLLQAFSLEKLNPEGSSALVDELVEKDFISAILYKRIKAYIPELVITGGALLWLISLTKGNPGNAVMQAAMLFYITNRGERKSVDIDLLTLEAYPFKIPTEEVYGTVWDAQKDGGANVLDKSEAWKV